MSINSTSIQNPRLPRPVRDWVVKTIIEDYSWDPKGGGKYNRSFGLTQVIRELLLEAATRPEFADHADIIIARANSRDPRSVVTNTFLTHKSKKEKYIRIEKYLFARYNHNNMFMSYVVEITRKNIVKNGIRRHVPGTIEQAVSYRNRLLAVLDGPKPFEWNLVPLFADE